MEGGLPVGQHQITISEVPAHGYTSCLSSLPQGNFTGRPLSLDSILAFHCLSKRRMTAMLVLTCRRSCRLRVCLEPQACFAAGSRPLQHRPAWPAAAWPLLPASAHHTFTLHASAACTFLDTQIMADVYWHGAWGEDKSLGLQKACHLSRQLVEEDDTPQLILYSHCSGILMRPPDHHLPQLLLRQRDSQSSIECTPYSAVLML